MKENQHMRILAIDDSESALSLLTDTIKEAVLDAEIFPFTDPEALLLFAQKSPCDIAFLDIQMWGMSGLEVAVTLKKIKHTTNIIFVTAYNQYQGDAFGLHASGYLMKPPTKEAILKEIENLRHPIDKRNISRVYVQTFGNFDVFLYGKPLEFKRSQAKETLAYLIDRRGTSATTAEIAAILWENRSYGGNLRGQTQVVISSMMKTLKDNNIDDIIIKSWNQISIDVDKVCCDYYELLKMDINAVNSFCGQYMAGYSWAEMTAATLCQKVNIF